MDDLNDIMDRLKRPFPTSSISWRIGSTRERDGETYGMPLAYIDARDVMDRLDDVVGPFAWQDRYTQLGPKTICAIGIQAGSDPTRAPDWIWKEDGAGDTDFEAEKGALSDAFKRAAVRWGIGRYLYDLKIGWIKVEKRGKSTIIPKDAQGTLDAAHDRAIEGIEWGDRTDRNAYRLALAAIQSIDAHELAEFESQHQGIIAQLPVAMRQNLSQKIIQIRSAMDGKRDAA